MDYPSDRSRSLLSTARSRSVSSSGYGGRNDLLWENFEESSYDHWTPVGRRVCSSQNQPLSKLCGNMSKMQTVDYSQFCEGKRHKMQPPNCQQLGLGRTRHEHEMQSRNYPHSKLAGTSHGIQPLNYPQSCNVQHHKMQPPIYPDENHEMKSRNYPQSCGAKLAGGNQRRRNLRIWENEDNHVTQNCLGRKDNSSSPLRRRRDEFHVRGRLESDVSLTRGVSPTEGELSDDVIDGPVFAMHDSGHQSDIQQPRSLRRVVLISESPGGHRLSTEIKDPVSNAERKRWSSNEKEKPCHPINTEYFDHNEQRNNDKDFRKERTIRARLLKQSEPSHIGDTNHFISRRERGRYDSNGISEQCSPVRYTKQGTDPSHRGDIHWKNTVQDKIQSRIPHHEEFSRHKDSWCPPLHPLSDRKNDHQFREADQYFASPNAPRNVRRRPDVASRDLTTNHQSARCHQTFRQPSSGDLAGTPPCRCHGFSRRNFQAHEQDHYDNQVDKRRRFSLPMSCEVCPNNYDQQDNDSYLSKSCHQNCLAKKCLREAIHSLMSPSTEVQEACSEVSHQSFCSHCQLPVQKMGRHVECRCPAMDYRSDPPKNQRQQVPTPSMPDESPLQQGFGRNRRFDHKQEKNKLQSNENDSPIPSFSVKNKSQYHEIVPTLDSTASPFKENYSLGSLYSRPIVSTVGTQTDDWLDNTEARTEFPRLPLCNIATQVSGEDFAPHHLPKKITVRDDSLSFGDVFSLTSADESCGVYELEKNSLESGPVESGTVNESLAVSTALAFASLSPNSESEIGYKRNLRRCVSADE